MPLLPLPLPFAEWERDVYLDALGAASREEDVDWDRRLEAGLSGGASGARGMAREQMDMYGSVLGESESVDTSRPLAGDSAKAPTR